MFGGVTGIIPGPINGSMYEDRHRSLSLRLMAAGDAKHEAAVGMWGVIRAIP